MKLAWPQNKMEKSENTLLSHLGKWDGKAQGRTRGCPGAAVSGPRAATGRGPKGQRLGLKLSPPTQRLPGHLGTDSPSEPKRRNLFLKWKSNIFHVKAPMCNSWAARNMRGYGTHMSPNCKTTACAPGGQVYIKLMDWTQFSSDHLWWGISSAVMSFLGDLSIDIMVNSMKKTYPKGSLSPQVNSKGFTSEAHISLKCLDELSAII